MAILTDALDLSKPIGLGWKRWHSDAFIVTDGSYTTWWSQRTGAPSPA